MSRGLMIACVAPVAVLLACCAWFQTRNSVTIDETFYLTAAKQVFRHGRFAQLDYSGVAHLPVVLAYGPAVALRGDLVADRPWAATDHDPATVEIARWTHALVVGVALVVVVVLWTFYRTRSVWAAGAGGLLTALSPTVVAHASLATTDVTFTLFYLLALAGLGWYTARPTAGSFFAAGGLIGLAIASKYGAALLFPVAFALGVLADWVPGAPDRPVSRRLLRVVTTHPLRTSGLVVVAFVVAWAATGFQLYYKPTGGEWVRKVVGSGPAGEFVYRMVNGVRLPSPAMGFLNQAIMVRSSSGGHPLYYVRALAGKSTPAELVIGLLAAAAVGAQLVRLAREKQRWDGIALALGVGLLFVSCSLSAKQFGVRYVLPVYPAAAILGVSSLAAVLPGTAVRRGALAALVGWQGVSLVCTGPRWVSYVNTLAGGNGRAHELYGHADVDIGQGAYDLRDFLSEHGETAVIAELTGTTKVTAYGLRDVGWEPEPPCRYVAIGQMSMIPGPRFEPYLDPFRTSLPKQVVGDSIYVYDTTHPAVLEAYRSASRLRREYKQQHLDPGQE